MSPGYLKPLPHFGQSDATLALCSASRSSPATAGGQLSDQDTTGVADAAVGQLSDHDTTGVADAVGFIPVTLEGWKNNALL